MKKHLIAIAYAIHPEDNACAQAVRRIFNLHKLQPNEIGPCGGQLRQIDLNNSDDMAVYKEGLRQSFDADVESGRYGVLGTELAEQVYAYMVEMLIVRDKDILPEGLPTSKGYYEVVLSCGASVKLWFNPKTSHWMHNEKSVGFGVNPIIFLNDPVPRFVLSWTPCGGPTKFDFLADSDL